VTIHIISVGVKGLAIKPTVPASKGTVRLSPKYQTPTPSLSPPLISVFLKNASIDAKGDFM
jgi:hypothetical protein